MSDLPVRLDSELTSEATRLASRSIESWIRVRITVFTAILIVGTLLVLDFVMVFVLPIPREIAQLVRRDILFFAPVSALVAGLVTGVELRSVSRAVRTLKLGLRLSEEERGRALRSALHFPVTLPLFVVGVATVGNGVTFVLDLFGRTPTIWYSLHVSVVTQCLVICACFPLFVFTRYTLRPFVRAVARDVESLGRGVGLRGRIGVLVATLVLLVSVPAASLLSLQLDAEAVHRHEGSKRQIAQWLGAELQEMGLHSFGRFLTTAQMGEGTQAFVVDTRGRVTPRSLEGQVGRAGLPPPTPGRVRVIKIRPNRHVVVAPASVPEGGYAWVGMVYDPRVPREARQPLVMLVLFLFLVGALLALVLGAGVARELRAVAGRLETIARGKSPEPLSAEVGSVAEIGRLIDGINDLLAAVDRRKLRGFVELEQAADAARSKTQFLANMSHDLRSPLTAVLGFVDFLLTELNGPLDEGQRARVSEIAGTARRLEALISVLLDRAKLESGRLRLERAWTPPATLVSRAMDRFAHQLGDGARHLVRVEVQAGLAPIYVDPEFTAEAIANLLLLLREGSMDGRARSGALAAVSGSAEEGGSEGPDGAPGASLDAKPVLTLRTARYQEDSGHGTEITVLCLDAGALDPTREDLFVDLVADGKQTRFRPSAVLIKQLIGRQRGRIVPVCEPGVSAGFRVRFPMGITGEMQAVTAE